MKPYRVTVEVTTTYTVEVHAENGWEAEQDAWRLDLEEIAAQGSVDQTETTAVYDAEEIRQFNIEPWEGREDE